MRKILFLILICLVVIGGLYSLGNPTVKNIVDKIIKRTEESSREVIANRSIALAKAKGLHEKAVAAGQDLSEGPCLAEEAIFDWSVDIVHIPRQGIDNEERNLCQKYMRGVTHHLIEMDGEGSIISIK